LSNREEIRCYNCGRLLLKPVPPDERRGVILVMPSVFEVKTEIEQPRSTHLLGKFKLKCGRCKTINLVASKIITKNLDLSVGVVPKEFYDLLEMVIKDSFLVNLSALERQKRSGEAQLSA